jgi:hypothetical protein
MRFTALPLANGKGEDLGSQTLNHMSSLHGKELTTELASRRTSTEANGLGADILLLDISNGSPAGLDQTPPCLILPPSLSVNLRTTDSVRPYSQLNTIAVKSQAGGNWNPTERWVEAGLLHIELRPELSAPASGFAAR